MASAEDDQKLYAKIKAVTSGQLKPEEQRKVNTSIKTYLESTKTTTELLNEIHTFVEDRERLRSRLLRVDYVSRKANLATFLRADDGMRKYDKIVNTARTIATDGKTAIEDLEVTLPAIMEDTQDPKEAITVIQSIKESINPNKQMDELKQELSKLAESMEDYITAVQKEIKDKASSQAEKIAKLVKELKEVNDQINEIDVNVIKPLMEFVKLGAGSFKDVADGAPVIAYSALFTSIVSNLEQHGNFKQELDAADKKRKRLEDERKAKEGEIDALEKELEKISDVTFIPDTLKSAQTDLKGLSLRIINFLSIKPELLSDLDSLIESLEAMPSGVKLSDKQNERVQDYHAKESLLAALWDINKKDLNKFVAPTLRL